MREKYSCVTRLWELEKERVRHRATSVKITWSLALHLFALLLVINITSEVILHVILLMSFIWKTVSIVKCQYVGSTTSFKQRYCIHKSDIKTKKDRCGTSN